MPALSRVSLSNFDWPLESLVAEPLLVTGAEDTAKVDSALSPLLSQFVGGSRGGGLLLHRESASPIPKRSKLVDVLGRCAAEAGRDEDLLVFRPAPRGKPSHGVPVRFQIFSCSDIAGEDYAEILLEPTASERIHEHLLSAPERERIEALRDQSKEALAGAINMLRHTLPGRSISMEMVSDTLVCSGHEPRVYRAVFDRFAPLLWNVALQAAFFSEEENTFAIDDMILGSKLVAFDLADEPPAAVEYAATLVKRLFLHRAAHGPARPDANPLWLMIDGDGLFLDRDDLSSPHAARSPLALVVSASSLSMVALTQDGAHTQLPVRDSGNRVMFRPQTTDGRGVCFGEPVPEGVEPWRLRSLGNHQAVLTRRGESPRAVALDGGSVPRRYFRAVYHAVVDRLQSRCPVPQGC